MTKFVIAAAVIIGLLVALNGFAPDALGYEHNQMSLVFYLCWLVLAGGALFATFRENWGEAIRNAVIWVVIALVLVAGYGVRHDLERLGKGTLAALVPGVAFQSGQGQIEIRMAEDGHFYVWGDADGQDVKFVVDTGASIVALNADDAARIGFEPDTLDFTMPIQTANGATSAAPVRIRELAIGDVRIDRVEAVVMRAGQLETSLLGMSFLGELSAYSFEGDRLVMRR